MIIDLTNKTIIDFDAQKAQIFLFNLMRFLYMFKKDGEILKQVQDK